MSINRLSFLLDKYRKGQCTDEEIKELESWYKSLDHQVFLKEYNSEEAREKLADEMFSNFKERTKQPESPKNRKISPLKRFIQAAAIMTGIGFTAWLSYQHINKSEFSQLNSTPQVISVNKNQFISLPDGSTVILKADSRLTYEADFGKNGRTVTLTGEAYFDVKHNASKPFIIHTGKLQTRVLGTAFNIKAYPGQKDIVVTVTRGKVQVQDENKILGILTPDKQIVYNSKTTATAEQEVKAEEELEWVKKDLVFDAASFKDIAGQLNLRYNVSIVFKNPALEQCPITATFSGTESLEQLLNVLCTSRNAHYKIINNQVIIDGKGC